MDTHRLWQQASYHVVNILFWCCMAVVCFLCIQVLFLSSFKIPTGSMEPTLLAGDYILVNKTIPGARLFNLFASMHDEETPVYRTPGIRSLRRNDVVVFNYPYPHGDAAIRMDIMAYYVKRCVGLPGDTLYIRNGYYRVPGVKQALGNAKGQLKARQLRAAFAREIKPDSLYPQDSLFQWDGNTFGPLYIPTKGDSLPLTRAHFALYHKLIAWEQQQPVRMETDGSCHIGGERVTSYRFRHNYYFMAGDFVQASLDSRYWGLVPEDYIVGKAWLIWKSVDTDTGRFRKERFFQRIR